ncbi:MAG: SCP2 sterol-binding domain-containing protein [Trueperaceae bacterium]|jgi:putative sterol carrier protein|nr:SCP2 sterol-binding domain-containing protein [Truepera sp.]HRN17840.1 SCP2 sterol-binding domain-containing protein [Trueperaceae bacterium]HRQ09643.1 SCP2 sterol-binding domain-containing protein [Trueperaceae bacterium]
MNAKQLLLNVPKAVTLDSATPRSVVQYDISEPIYHVIEGGVVSAHEGKAEGPDVTIKVSDADLVKLFDGQLNPMAAVFTGRLKVRGDVGLAQRLIKMVDREKLQEAKARLEAEGDGAGQ